jgi:hypothetical protein
MTFADYLVNADVYYRQNQGQRYGQALVNFLQSVSSEAYCAIPDQIDPYYKNENVGDFLEWLGDNWGSFIVSLCF